MPAASIRSVLEPSPVVAKFLGELSEQRNLQILLEWQIRQQCQAPGDQLPFARTTSSVRASTKKDCLARIYLNLLGHEWSKLDVRVLVCR